MADALLRARDAASDAERLAALLDAWADRPLDELVPVIERAAQRAATPPVRTASHASKAEAEHDEWMVTALRGEPADLDWLLAHLVTAHGWMARERIKQLVTRPVDPRFGPALLGIARAKPLSTHRPFWTMVLQLLNRNAHHRLAPLIAPLLTGRRITTFDEHLHDRLARLLRRVQTMTRLDPMARELALLAEISTRLASAEAASPTKTADDFLREIWTTPDDDGLREVFADWLMLREDPRGELIMLQLARHRGVVDATAARRERALLAAHARSWMGSLAPAVHATKFTFERGFLASCAIVWKRLSPALMTDPAWATVREYEISNEAFTPCAPWREHMRTLGAPRRPRLFR